MKIRWKPMIFAGLIALAIHLQLVFTDVLPAMYRFWSGLFPRMKFEQPVEVSLVALSQREWEENLQLQPELKVKEKEADQKSLVEEQQEEKEKDLKGQVVDVAPTQDSSRPEDARFLSEHNTRVQKESVSRHQRKDYGVAQPHPTVAEFSRRSPDKVQEESGEQEVALLLQRQGQRSPAKSNQPFSFELPDIHKRQSLKLKLDLPTGTMPTYQASDELRGNSDRLRLWPGRLEQQSEDASGEEGDDQKTLAMFRRPSLDKLDMVTGAPSNDHIQDVSKGEETLLNSREFRYATFFNRIKRGVSDHWDPGEVYLRNDPYGNIYGVKDRYTVLNVELDAGGGLKDVSVVQSCGVGFLDEEAVSAFNHAAPFPNPPQGLLEADGRIRFQFGFYFEIGERPRIRAFQFRQYP